MNPIEPATLDKREVHPPRILCERHVQTPEIAALDEEPGAIDARYHLCDVARLSIKQQELWAAPTVMNELAPADGR